MFHWTIVSYSFLLENLKKFDCAFFSRNIGLTIISKNSVLIFMYWPFSSILHARPRSLYRYNNRDTWFVERLINQIRPRRETFPRYQRIGSEGLSSVQRNNPKFTPSPPSSLRPRGGWYQIRNSERHSTDPWLITRGWLASSLTYLYSLLPFNRITFSRYSLVASQFFG